MGPASATGSPYRGHLLVGDVENALLLSGVEPALDVIKPGAEHHWRGTQPPSPQGPAAHHFTTLP